jgi:hypothetical protein
MECAFGLKGKDFAIVACDGHVDFSIINFKKDEDKIRVVCFLFGRYAHISFRWMEISFSPLQDRRLNEASSSSTSKRI